MKTYTNFSKVLFVGLALVLSFGRVHAALEPTLNISAFGLSQVQINVTGADPNATVALHYSSAASTNIGVTNANGSMTVVADQSQYNLSGGQFYATVDGVRSSVIYYPSAAAPGTLSLSASQTTLSVGQIATFPASAPAGLTLLNNASPTIPGSVPLLLSTNTNPSIATISVADNHLIVTGASPGTTAATLCIYNINCSTMNITVTGNGTSIPANSPASICVNLPANLYQGLSDATTNGNVTRLQNYLVSVGDLTATPNGHFGSATFAAVKKFQAANNISVVGQAGPATRAVIQRLSCAVPSSVVIAQPSNSSVPVSNSNVPTVISTPSTVSGSVAVTNLQSGSALSLGQQIILQWNAQTGTNYNIVLEDQYGVGYGYITSNINANYYSWTVGNVISTNGSGNHTVSPGVYRIDVQNAATGASASDQMSGLFSIAATPLTISNVLPSSASNNGKTTVILYGSGFNTSSMINFDTNSNAASPAYISPDGTAIAFTVPTTISAGLHTVSVTDTYAVSTTTATMTSNAMNITITASAQ